jgi:hypothetical protein
MKLWNKAINGFPPETRNGACTYPLGWTDNIDGTSRAYQIGFIAGHDSRYKEQYLDGIHWDVKMWCQFFMKRMETAKKQEAKKTKEARPGESTK